MENIRLLINGREIEAAPGSTILDVVRENGLDDIPTLCHSKELEPYGSCFLCVVEVKGKWNLVPSCATRIAPDMEVVTRNERILNSRKTALELLLSNHYADCVSPCMEGCPANVDAQGYIALSAMGEYRKAIDLIREANPFPAACGRVCVRKCEIVCRRADVDSSVGINAVKRFVSDVPGAYDGMPECEPPSGKTVGIVGAGPSGLTAAWFLGRKGHKTVLYEANERAGGMLRYGIPEYRLPDDTLDAEIEYICRTGALIRYGIRIGEGITLDQLRDDHDAVYIAAGAWAGKPMRVEGEFDTAGVVTGADFLPDRAMTRELLQGTVVVVGGGNTAMDVARTAWRLGAEKVIILYRRTKAEMPADEMEIRDCLEEGIEIMELAAPIGIISENGFLRALRCLRMKLGEPDESGRRRPVPMEGSEFDLPCEMAVSAIGQDTVLKGLTSVDGKDIEMTRWNTYAVDSGSMRTNIEGVFAGGDAADDGPTVVIDAIRDGRIAADTIHSWLTGEAGTGKPFAVSKEFWAKPGTTELGAIKESPRHEVHTIPVEDRVGSFSEVAWGFEFEDNVHECERCLSCGCVRFDDCDLRLYAQEYGVDMDHYKGHVRKHRVDDRHPYIAYDPNKCILCSRCIRTCARILPISAIGLINRGFRTEMRPAMKDPLVETSCVSCGNCVDSCPTAALTVKYPFPGRASLVSEELPAHCGFCSLVCATRVRKFGDERYYITSSGEPGEYLCRYGRFGHELFIRQKRITVSEVRSGSSRRQVSPSDAVKLISTSLRNVAKAHGAGSIGVFVSPELTCEELFLAGRIAREGLGTSGIGSLSVLGTGMEAGLLDASFGFTACTDDRSCIADADLIVCNNTSMETDHLILAVDVIQAVKGGAKLIVVNSSLDTTDQLLSSIALDPLRGRSAVLWNGITRLLMDEGYLGAEGLPGADAFLSTWNVTVSDASDMSGVDREDMKAAAAILRNAEKIVFIHNPDRPRDRAPGDMETLANLIVLLRAAGADVDLLLPRIISNSAALEVTGADPAFEPGRVPVSSSAGVHSHSELRELLEEGNLKAALILGEDPLAWGRTGEWLNGVEFLAAMDWTDTETTRYADVVLPGSTFLETRGLRLNFEGSVTEFSRVIEPPAGLSGREMLVLLAREFGLDVSDDLTEQMTSLIEQKIGDMAAYYWNTGLSRSANTPGNLVVPDTSVRTGSIPPPLTHGEKYKREILEVGTDRFRVKY
jgi:formate dehydrogenase major subunit